MLDLADPIQHGFESLVPPLVAILLAIATRQVVFPLAAGVFAGAVLLARANPEKSLLDSFAIFAGAIDSSLRDFDHLQTLAFTLLLGAMVGVMEMGGGIAALIAKLSRWIRSRRSAQAMISLSGLAIFFDDYANTLLIGGTMRSTADRYGLSRAKLAYLVDSTAAPVAGLSLVSTWAAIEISYMSEGLADAGITTPSAGFTLFIQSIPYRFYPILAIVMVFLISITGRDFASMKRAEETPRELAADSAAASKETTTTYPPRLWLAAVLSIVACVAALGTTLVVTGWPAEPSTTSNGVLQDTIEILGNGKSYLALILGGAVGLATAWLTHAIFGNCDLKTLAMGTLRGGWQMMPAMIILWLAWALSGMTGEDALQTGDYLSSLLSDRLDPRALPTVVFALAGFVAFSTGTSWGTMAILTPLSVTLSLDLAPSGGPGGAICLATTGSVLAGAIFGDHCSPISDTTVLSSRACGCDHLQHVRTQMPYAITVALVCVAMGSIPAVLGVSPWICLIMGTVALAVIVRFVGKHPTP
ncbi:Na+/H+ antiporter NhaC family protein [Novipirellula caenicola]|uniref:Na+/H+ antiporter NhaC-like C-terminal domain-containing protein n=1 Tax=Novipirellula caenicola TaxID=1536901 RepID=A0ABP9VST5_9BACT